MNTFIDYCLLGSRINEIRKRRRITQENLAEKVNVSSVYISRIERGTTKISLEKLIEICIALKVDSGYILTGIEYKSPYYKRNEIIDMLDRCPANIIALISEIIEKIIEYHKPEN